MPADMHRVILAGVQAALEESRAGSERKRRHLPAGRALVLGAGLVTAARLATGARARGMVGTIQNGVTRLQGQFLDGHEPEPEGEEDPEDYEGEEDPEDYEGEENEEDEEEPEDEEDPEE